MQGNQEACVISLPHALDGVITVVGEATVHRQEES
jgi:hypothetical protein